MGQRGPSPTPGPILEARGSWRAKGRNGKLVFPVEAPECPAWLSTEARAEWDRVVQRLKDAGIVAQVDRACLAVYCQAWGEFVMLQWRIDELLKEKDGLEAAIGKGLVSMRNKAAERLVKVADRFGFSAAARERVNVAEQPGAAANGKGRFFNTVG